MSHVMCILGTRPEIIKMAPVIKALQSKRNVKLTIVHSGQHYDAELSQFFFKELDLPRPDLNLRIGSGSHAQQTAQMLMGYEQALHRFQPDIALAEGDTNTVLAAGLSSVKLRVTFGHVEAGLRCFDRTMPEEINRTIADDCAQLCFAPTDRSAKNLLREGIAPKRIFVTGNTIVDACRKNLPIARSVSGILERLGLDRGVRFALATVHRDENVANPNRLRRILRGLAKLSDFKVVFPVHPRTKKELRVLGLDRLIRKARHILTTKPLGYWDFLRLLDNCQIVLTDSGGVQEEALTVGVPCVTLRYSTERPETVEAGGNVLVGTEVPLIVGEARRLSEDRRLRDKLRDFQNPLGDGRAGQRIADICVQRPVSEYGVRSTSYMRDGSAYFRLMRVRRERRVGWLQEKEPTLTITKAYDSRGNPVFPEEGLQLRKGWHVETFGQPSELGRLVSLLS